MKRRDWYRPKRKDDLIRHLEEYHTPAHPRFYRLMGWTVKALEENHDGLHEGRYVEAGK